MKLDHPAAGEVVTNEEVQIPGAHEVVARARVRPVEGERRVRQDWRVGRRGRRERERAQPQDSCARAEVVKARRNEVYEPMHTSPHLVVCLCSTASEMPKRSPR